MLRAGLTIFHVQNLEASAAAQKNAANRQSLYFAWLSERKALDQEEAELTADLQSFGSESRFPTSLAEGTLNASEAFGQPLVGSIAGKVSDCGKYHDGEVLSRVNKACAQARQVLARRRVRPVGAHTGQGQEGSQRQQEEEEVQHISQEITDARVALQALGRALDGVYAEEEAGGAAKDGDDEAEGGRDENARPSSTGSVAGGALRAARAVRSTASTASPADRVEDELALHGSYTLPPGAEGLREQWARRVREEQTRAWQEVQAMDAAWVQSCQQWAIPSTLRTGKDAPAGVEGEEDIDVQVGAVPLSTHRTGRPELGGWTGTHHAAYLHACSLWSRYQQAKGLPASLPSIIALLPPRRTAKETGSIGREIPCEQGFGIDLAATVSTLCRLDTTGLPPPTRAQIAAHHAWYQGRRVYVTARAARVEQWLRDRRALVQQAEEAFLQAREKAEEEACSAQARALHESIRAAAHARLSAARARAEVERAVSRAYEEEMRQAQEPVGDSVKMKRQQRSAAMKAALEVYRAEMASAEARMASIRASIAAEAAARREEEGAAAQERVAYRKELLQKRRERVQLLEEQAAAVDAERAALVERLIASVPYASRLAEIAEAPGGDRVNAPTASAQAHAELGRAYAAYLKALHGGGTTGGEVDGDGAHDAPPVLVVGATSHGAVDLALAASRTGGTGGQAGKTKAALLQLANTRLKEQGLFGRAGYSDKQVTGDKRWRFVSALRAAGVGAQDGSAARVALGSLNEGVRGSTTAAIIHQGGAGLS